MMEPMMWLAVAGAAISAGGVLMSARDAILLVRAERELVRVLAERDEFRPLMSQLRAREAHAGGLEVTEYEAIDLRDRVRQALAYLSHPYRKRVEARLYSPMVRGREFYLHKVLWASLHRPQHLA